MRFESDDDVYEKTKKQDCRDLIRQNNAEETVCRCGMMMGGVGRK